MGEFYSCENMPIWIQSIPNFILQLQLNNRKMTKEKPITYKEFMNQIYKQRRKAGKGFYNYLETKFSSNIDEIEKSRREIWNKKLKDSNNDVYKTLLTSAQEADREWE